MTVKMTGGLAQPVTAITGLAQLGTNGRKTRDTGRHSATEAELRGSASARTGQSKTPSELAPAGVSTWTTWRRRRNLNPRTPYGISTLAGPLCTHHSRLFRAVRLFYARLTHHHRAEGDTPGTLRGAPSRCVNYENIWSVDAGRKVRHGGRLLRISTLTRPR
jgi:hypothetical protein